MARILIIDDDAELRQLLAEVVRSAGHEVLLATDGATGLRALQEQTPDLVITDIVMPEKDGFELLLELRSRKTPPKTIAISGAPPQWMVLHSAEALGTLKTLAKPFTPSELIETIDAVLTRDAGAAPCPDDPR